jgi:hypothetical protein
MTPLKFTEEGKTEIWGPLIAVARSALQVESAMESGAAALAASGVATRRRRNERQAR